MAPKNHSALFRMPEEFFNCSKSFIPSISWFLYSATRVLGNETNTNLYCIDIATFLICLFKTIILWSEPYSTGIGEKKQQQKRPCVRVLSERVMLGETRFFFFLALGFLTITPCHFVEPPPSSTWFRVLLHLLTR